MNLNIDNGEDSFRKVWGLLCLLPHIILPGQTFVAHRVQIVGGKGGGQESGQGVSGVFVRTDFEQVPKMQNCL